MTTFSAFIFRHLRQCIQRVHNIVWFAGQIDWNATSICVKIIVFWEVDAWYSISSKSGGKICLKDIVSNISLDLPKVLSQFMFYNRVSI